MKYLRLLFIVFFVQLFFANSYLFSQFDDGNYWSDLFRKRSGPMFETFVGGGPALLVQENLQKPLIGIDFRIRYQDLYDNPDCFYFGVSYFFKQKQEKIGSFSALPKTNLANDTIRVPYNYSESVGYFSFNVGWDHYFLLPEEKPVGFYLGVILGVQFPFFSNEYQLADYENNKYSLLTPKGWRKSQSDNNIQFKLGLNIGFDWEFLILKENSKNSNQPSMKTHQLYFEISPYIASKGKSEIQNKYKNTSTVFGLFTVGYRIETASY